MRGIVRVGVRVGVALALLGAVASAYARQPKLSLHTEPVVATGGGQTLVAWTANGIVQVASENADGSFTHGGPVGRSIGSFSPQAEITPTGEQMVVWKTLRTLKSAVRYSAESAWKYQNIAYAGRPTDPHLFMDSSGRAIVTWLTRDGAPSYTSSLFASTRLPLGSWSPPQQLVGPALIAGSSATVDSDGDVVVTYAAVPIYGPSAGSGKYSVYAMTLPSRATEWTAPVVISGSDDLRDGPRVAGGGARTFVVTWTEAGPVPPVPSVPTTFLRTARLRLPDAWEAPQMLLPLQDPQTGLAYATVPALEVDAFGNALAIARYRLAAGTGLDSVRLPASAATWHAPDVVDLPQGGPYLIDSPPALTIAEDGSATLAFLRESSEGNTLRLATTEGVSDVWQSAQTDVGSLRSCAHGAIPGQSIYCPVASETTLAFAAGSPALTVAVQGFYGDVFAFARTTPDTPWQGPETLVAVGRTEASLRAGTARPGTVQIVATCTLPPCHGVAVLRMRDKPYRVLGSASFVLPRAGTALRSIALPLWARTRVARPSGLWTRLSFGVHEGDGTSEETRLPYSLSGVRWIRPREGG